MNPNNLRTAPDADRATQALHAYLLRVSAGPELETILTDPDPTPQLQAGTSLFRAVSSERMRANLFIDLKAHGATMADGLAVNRAWAEIFSRLAQKGITTVDCSRERDLRVKGYPDFLTPHEAPEGLVLRKWCKSARNVIDIAQRGYLEAAHSGLNRYGVDYVPSVQFPDVTGVMLADPAASPFEIGWHDLSHHYIDVVFEGAAILHTFHPQKFIAPLPARVREHAWENAIAGVQHLPVASDRDSELMRMVRHDMLKAPLVPLRFARIAGSSIGGFVEPPDAVPESGVRNGEGPAARAAPTAALSAWRPLFRPAFVPANPALAAVR